MSCNIPKDWVFGWLWRGPTMAGIKEKLAYLMDKAGVAGIQFTNDFNARFKTRKDLIGQWLSGARDPTRPSLEKIARYWAERFPGIEPHWFDADFRQFRILIEGSPEKRAAKNLSAPLVPDIAKIDPQEGR